MSAFPLTDQSRIRRRHGLSFPLLLSLAVASALTGAVVALVVQRLLQGAQYIEVLPQPAPERHLQESSAPSENSETAGEASVAPDLAERAELATAESGAPASPLGNVAAGLSMKRAAELGQVAETDDDVVMGDGSLDCPTEFPVKGNGRSGIYHWPGASAYHQTTPTLCFRSPEAAERAGFRAAKR